MKRSRVLPFALVAALVFSLVLTIQLTPDTASAEEAPSRLALHMKGAAKQEAAEPNRFLFTTDLYSIATGEKVGTVTVDATITGPGVGVQITTFHLPGGDIVTRQVLDFAPSTNPSHSAFFLRSSAHPEENNIVAENGTANYAGRTGRVQMWGWDDLRKMPDEITFDDLYLIELDPMG